MKLKYLMLMFILATMAISSCKDNFMNWEDNNSISAEDVPLTTSEKIARYDYLKNYTDIKLGIGAGLSFYMTSDTTYSSIVNRNFDDVTIGYNMKHGAMVSSTGTISFTKVDSMLAKLNRNGLTLYGHCLVWHANQNATYLNSLIEPSLTYTNLINNGTFESSGVSGWSIYNGTTDALSLSTDAYEGSGSMKVINTTNNSSSQWKTQIHTSLNASMISGTTYNIVFYIKSDSTGSVRCSTTGTAQYQSDITTSTNWTKITWSFTANGTETGFNFDLGKVKGTYYIDNVTVYNPSASISVEKSDTEKATIIKGAMEDWISQMMTHYKGSVTAWDVLNEPIDGSTDAVRTDYVDADATDVFPWMKYLGKDYGVYAFQFAREYGNGSSDKLFINDYGLESDLSKCQALIDYVSYIEGQGATIDGIGTQMHISISNDTTMINKMFEMLAATGKLIRISELDVTVDTDSPGSTELEEQAEMYQFVVNSYKKYIPTAQQYEITVWGVSDNENEHTDWLPDDAPNLWDASYARKQAYKGFADGLAGYDVSSGFTGIVYTPN